MGNDIAAMEDSRGKIIVKTSIIGILANVFLAVFKAVIGFLTGSIAIVLDAVNNISDAASSLITIIGTKLAGKEPDKKHPFGYGRIEYLSAMVISVIVLYAGVTSFTESVKKIITPNIPEYTKVSLIIVAAAVIVKIVLGKYVKGVGKKVNSDSLVNSGEDAMLDSIISSSTLVAAIIFLIFNISLEAWLGAFISIVIIKSGIDMNKETISHLLGESVDSSLAAEIKKVILERPEVSGVYDLILHNYGPDMFNGSVHVEVPDTLSADQIDQLSRDITMTVYSKCKVALTAIGIYSVNTKNDEAALLRDKVRHIVLGHEYVTQMHGFYVEEDRKAIRFDLVISFDAPSRVEVYKEVVRNVMKEFPEYRIEAVMDTDFSEYVENE